MRKYLTKKRMIVLAVIALAVGGAGGAYAYFSSTGTGTGSATVGSSSDIQLSSSSVGPLYPGATATPVTVHVHNPGGGAEYVDTISGSVADNGNCLGSWFTVTVDPYGNDVAGGTDGPDATGTVQLNDENLNQDACQGKTMTINWSSN